MKYYRVTLMLPTYCAYAWGENMEIRTPYERISFSMKHSKLDKNYGPEMILSEEDMKQFESVIDEKVLLGDFDMEEAKRLCSQQ